MTAWPQWAKYRCWAISSFTKSGSVVRTNQKSFMSSQQPGLHDSCDQHELQNRCHNARAGLAGIVDCTLP